MRDTNVLYTKWFPDAPKRNINTADIVNKIREEYPTADPHSISSLIQMRIDRARFDHEDERLNYFMQMDILELLNGLVYDHNRHAEFTMAFDHKGTYVAYDELYEVLRRREDDVINQTYYKYKFIEDIGWYKTKRYVTIIRPVNVKRHNVTREDYVAPLSVGSMLVGCLILIIVAVFGILIASELTNV